MTLFIFIFTSTTLYNGPLKFNSRVANKKETKEINKIGIKRICAMPDCQTPVIKMISQFRVVIHTPHAHPR